MHSHRDLCRPTPPGLVGSGRNESRPRDLPWLWASAQLSLTSAAVEARARQGNESKTCLGADPTGSWRQVASSENVLDGVGAKSLTLREQTEMKRWEVGEKRTSLAAGGSWKRAGAR